MRTFRARSTSRRAPTAASGSSSQGFFALVSALSWWRGHTGWHYLLPIAVAFLVVAYTYPSLWRR
jgi:hypothetical protein